MILFIKKIGNIGDDNRAGIERTLHRISLIRNRAEEPIGVTCRVGRAVFGSVKIIEDFIGSEKSILIMGKPGIGKTTMIREISRIIADKEEKRVVVVDTSNEIAGDGDIPHPAIGSARRMQVRNTDLQHNVMIEAEELGITSTNADAMKTSENPAIKRLVGAEGETGAALALDQEWSLRIIKQVGNYGESYERNVGPDTPVGLSRGPNAQWINGGILYANPTR